jgi:hypothetical protein
MALHVTISLDGLIGHADSDILGIKLFNTKQPPDTSFSLPKKG